METTIKLKEAYQALGISSLNEMQEATIDQTQNQQDLILLSPTGSGKTVGFLLPILRELTPANEVQALIMAPSRELALQIEQVFKNMKTGFKANCVYGGHSVYTEIKSLSVPPQVLIGTPGRLKEHLERGTFSPQSLKILVLDEFDKALEYGFWRDMEDIMAQFPHQVQKILTSATQAIDIPRFVGMEDATTLNFLKEDIPKGLTLHALRAEGTDKLDTLLKLIGTFGQDPTLIFCNHRAAVDRIGEHLRAHRILFDAFHGGLAQDVRERSLLKFRNGSIQFLLTTDLASRGLDIPEIKHIVHYQLPLSEDAYIHRNGRTARMHAEGKAYLVCSEEEDIPDYVTSSLDWMDTPEEYQTPTPPEWATIYFSGGKKQKINKIDIVGLLSKKGMLQRDEVGLIEVKDFSSYAAVKRNKLEDVLKRIRKEKVKKQRLKIEEAF